MTIPLSGYKKRLLNRQNLTKRIGPNAFYQTKAGRTPKPLFALLKMLNNLR